VRDLWCPRCGGRVFFDDQRCLACGDGLAYDVSSDRMVGVSRSHLCPQRQGPEACNWTTAAPASPCPSCRLDTVGADPQRSPALDRLPFQQARRRTVRQLRRRKLDPDTAEPPLRFALRRSTADEPVTIGHADGLVTLDVAEADPRAREHTRITLGEPYRTPLGHVRHEVGHWVWAVRVEGADALEAFRERFGDERASYPEALERHYGAADDGRWWDRFLSHYASAHPWEDFAESFAHLLHLDDTLETAVAHGLVEAPSSTFDERYRAWLTLSVALNELNRSMGTPDPYPFSPSGPAVDKIRWVDSLLGPPGREASTPAAPRVGQGSPAGSTVGAPEGSVVPGSA
jgi:hypothetical protein